ncbi:hypothetical protein JJD41_22010 [Oxynema sp. CENA135]|uniref:hypothetical protein n=1 Tax=Oxynema sp. CENA135 TaxID=984206 RepID=UPI00190BB970|nr:hypothetical protein [Oxynema sp. CENA135]MBK4732518.1 hypothetical protein [Oxynema sp. CENA135]
MDIFSPESLLLARHWESYRELLEIEPQLEREIGEFLAAIESELVKQAWWKNEWSFVAYEQSEIYIANQNWVSPYEEFVLSIGLEGVTPNRLFGRENPPQFYVKSSDYNLCKLLTDKLADRESLEFVEMDYSSSRYLLTKPLPKVLPEEVEQFGEVVKPQIVEFLSFYAQLLWEFNPIIEEAIG